MTRYPLRPVATRNMPADEKKPNISDDESHQFRAAMGKITPLPEKQRMAKVTKAPVVTPRKISETEQEFAAAYMHNPELPPEPVYGDTIVSFNLEQLAPKIRRKLKKGEIYVDAVLDLHGITIDEASQLIPQFIANQQILGHRWIRIIHGKGGRQNQGSSALKSWVVHWLKQAQEILSFCSAHSKHGGAGALIVLLKKHNH